MKRQLIKAQNKQAIVDAAMKLFIEKGIENTTIQDIVEGASLARGTFYNYFKTKYDIWNIIIKEILSELKEVLFQARRNSPSLEDFIHRGYIEGLVPLRKDSRPALMTKNQSIFREYWFSSEEMQTILSAIKGDLREHVSLKNAPDTYLTMITYSISGGALEMTVASHVNQDGLTNKQIADYMTNMILAAIRGPENGW